jgi:hypothetical protein
VFLNQTKQIIPRTQLCLPPHRQLKFPLKQNQQNEVRELEKIKYIPSIPMLCLYPHTHWDLLT